MNKSIEITLTNNNNMGKKWQILFLEGNQLKSQLIKEIDWVENNIRLGDMLGYFIKLNQQFRVSFNWIKFNIVEFDLVLPALLGQTFPDFYRIYRDNKNFIL